MSVAVITPRGKRNASVTPDETVGDFVMRMSRQYDLPRQMRLVAFGRQQRGIALCDERKRVTEYASLRVGDNGVLCVALLRPERIANDRANEWDMRLISSLVGGAWCWLINSPSVDMAVKALSALLPSLGATPTQSISVPAQLGRAKASSKDDTFVPSRTRNFVRTFPQGHDARSLSSSALFVAPSTLIDESSSDTTSTTTESTSGSDGAPLSHRLFDRECAVRVHSVTCALDETLRAHGATHFVVSLALRYGALGAPLVDCDAWLSTPTPLGAHVVLGELFSSGRGLRHLPRETCLEVRVCALSATPAVATTTATNSIAASSTSPARTPTQLTPIGTPSSSPVGTPPQSPIPGRSPSIPSMVLPTLSSSPPSSLSPSTNELRTVCCVGWALLPLYGSNDALQVGEREIGLWRGDLPSMMSERTTSLNTTCELADDVVVVIDLQPGAPHVKWQAVDSTSKDLSPVGSKLRSHAFDDMRRRALRGEALSTDDLALCWRTRQSLVDDIVLLPHVVRAALMPNVRLLAGDLRSLSSAQSLSSSSLLSPRSTTATTMATGTQVASAGLGGRASSLSRVSHVASTASSLPAAPSASKTTTSVSVSDEIGLLVRAARIAQQRGKSNRTFSLQDGVLTLALLAHDIVDLEARRFAVDVLDELDDAYIVTLMPQLLTALCNDLYDDSALAMFLLRRSIGSKVVAQRVFWLGRCMTHDQRYAQRVGLLLEHVLRSDTDVLLMLRRQIDLKRGLIQAAKQAHELRGSERLSALRSQLRALTRRIWRGPMPIDSPIDPR